MKLNYWDDPWPFEEERPGDLLFTHYLHDHHIKDKVIFHFGTGIHHLIGKDNYECGNPNEILAVTVCKPEYEAYIDFIINNPKAANCYKVLFADIYTLSERILPTFDLVTLFHLGECFDEQAYSEKLGIGPPQMDRTRLNSAYARLDDFGVLKLFINKLNPGGKLAFITDTEGFRRNDFVAAGNLVATEKRETLLVCTPRASAS